MPDQPNKSAGAFKDGKPRPVDEQQAVRNQGEATPDDYPEPARLDDSDIGTTGTA